MRIKSTIQLLNTLTIGYDVTNSNESSNGGMPGNGGGGNGNGNSN